jgi:hypothetical protein
MRSVDNHADTANDRIVNDTRPARIIDAFKVQLDAIAVV